MSSSLIEYLQRFSPIPAADRSLIDAAWTVRALAEGEPLVVAGQVCRELFFIEEGVVRIVVPQATGKQVTHFFLKEGQFCTILASFTTQQPATEGIQAACAGRVLAISRARLEELYQQLPYLQGLLMQLIQQGLLDKIAMRRAYLGQNSTTRYQQFLLRQPEVARRVSLTDVASYLGITLQSLSRLRKNLR
ncbi:Crp/Fnr family transcriptional regulator [Hymenobacter sp. BRD128]|uniref:Crp/Fnr family transcriptional regulator n=1 Tax=Hymenobacter sp. BRD128 TaxID=2675878 RepID=UPI00156384A5|nr:Crp/Fnr family transcriptional regulator [Hymenobacter sp. BRD128]QKG58002.1 Crp/Fnr family transcriptional regulator [Hymenobacter sp. BRD128]